MTERERTAEEGEEEEGERGYSEKRSEEAEQEEALTQQREGEEERRRSEDGASQGGVSCSRETHALLNFFFTPSFFSDVWEKKPLLLRNDHIPDNPFTRHRWISEVRTRVLSSSLSFLLLSLCVVWPVYSSSSPPLSPSFFSSVSLSLFLLALV